MMKLILQSMNSKRGFGGKFLRLNAKRGIFNAYDSRSRKIKVNISGDRAITVSCGPSQFLGGLLFLEVDILLN